jgi:hypothetical protein
MGRLCERPFREGNCLRGAGVGGTAAIHAEEPSYACFSVPPSLSDRASYGKPAPFLPSPVLHIIRSRSMVSLWLSENRFKPRRIHPLHWIVATDNVRPGRSEEVVILTEHGSGARQTMILPGAFDEYGTRQAREDGAGTRFEE